MEGERREIQTRATPEPGRITNTRRKKRSAKAEMEKKQKTPRPNKTRKMVADMFREGGRNKGNLRELGRGQVCQAWRVRDKTVRNSVG